jgi:small subunit ribosomal protein S16
LVKIRLQRRGKRNRPYYRIVVTDSRNPRSGKVLEIVGNYDPLREGEFAVNLERVNFWISRGAQLTPRAKKVVDLARRRIKGMSAANSNESSKEEV